MQAQSDHHLKNNSWVFVLMRRFGMHELRIWFVVLIGWRTRKIGTGFSFLSCSSSRSLSRRGLLTSINILRLSEMDLALRTLGADHIRRRLCNGRAASLSRIVVDLPVQDFKGENRFSGARPGQPSMKDTIQAVYVGSKLDRPRLTVRFIVVWLRHGSRTRKSGFCEI